MLYVNDWMDNLSLLTEGLIILSGMMIVFADRKHRISTVFKILCGAIVYGCLCYLLNNLELFPLWIMLAKVLVLFSWTFLLMPEKSSISKRIVSVSISMFIYLLIGFIIDSVMILFDVGIHSLRTGYLRLMYNKELHQGRFLLNLLVQPLAVFVLQPLYRRVNTIPSKYQGYTAILCFILAVFSQIFTVSVLQNRKDLSGVITVITWVVLMVAMIMTVIIFLLQAKAESDRRDYEMIRTMNHSLSEGYRLLADKNDELRIQSHDFHNHLLAMQRMNEQEVHAYIANLLHQQQTAKTWISTENRYLDAVINSKIPVMHANDITFYHNIRIPEITGISHTDLCTITSNQLDNAIEACQKIPEPNDRWISFTIDQGGDLLSILCENSIVPGSVMTEEQLKETSKNQDKHMHGLGIRSIELCAARNNGVLIHEIREDSFLSKVVLSCNSDKNTDDSNKK